MNSRFGIAVLAAISLRPAMGLDPNRTLTQYIHRIWQAQQGLPEGTIYSIIQAHDGYLWLGTQTGFNRFDGVRFEPVEHIWDKFPSGVWIRGSIEDSRHAFWLATNESGLYRLEGDSVQHYSVEDGFPSAEVGCVASTRNGDIWACTTNGAVRIRDGKLDVFSAPKGSTTNNFQAACEADDGTLWMADEDRLNSWDGSKFVAHKLAKLPSEASIRALQCSGDTVWVGTTEGLLEFKKTGERFYTSKDGLADSRVLSLAAGRDGGLWIGTRNGFSRLRKGEIESYRPQEGLSQSAVFSMVEDAEGSLWVGTKNGLNQFFSARALPYSVNEGLPSNDTGPILQDKRGNIWIGTLGEGLARFDGKRFETTTSKQGLASNTIQTLAEDHGGLLWVGTTEGIDRLRNGHLESHYSTAQGLPSADIRALFVTRGGTMWVGTDKGPAEFANGRFSIPRKLPEDLKGPIAAINEDQEGRVFLATEQEGLFIIEKNGSVHEQLQNGEPIRNADALFLDSEGLMWIGTQGDGLRLLDHGKMASFFVRDGMFDNEIYGIIRDEEGRFWMACSKGLFWVNRADLLKFAAGKLKKLVSTPFSPTDALRTIECRSGVQPGSGRMQDGRLWFSTTRGLYVFDTRHLSLNIPPPPVVVEETTVNGERVEPTAIGKLAPGLKNLEFTYSGLTFLQPNRIRFRYILEGFDKNWIQAGTRREAFYTNLPPGQYRFRVTACNGDGVCNETGASASFSLAPHFYQRAWFLPLCAVALVLAGWMIYQLRIHRLREQFHLIITERSRIARELHDTLIQGLSGITMEMQALAGRLRVPEERAILEDIVQDAGTCLRETRRSVAGLRSAQGPDSGLAQAIAQAAKEITEAKNVRLKLNLEKSPNNLSPEVQYNLLRIASEAVSNSVKHSGAKVIEVTLSRTAEELQLSIKDDGSGLSRENGSARPGHYGVIGMKERAAQIGARLSLSSEPGQGTTICVLLPISLLTPKATVGVHIL
jgi:ligand-binding sensor domain-containing protein/signal transduction histidine kinase